MLKPSLKKGSWDSIQPIAGEDKEVYTFPKGLSPKVNMIAPLEFELAYHDIAVQHVSHDTMGTPPSLRSLGMYRL